MKVSIDIYVASAFYIPTFLVSHNGRAFQELIRMRSPKLKCFCFDDVGAILADVMRHDKQKQMTPRQTTCVKVIQKNSLSLCENWDENKLTRVPYRKGKNGTLLRCVILTSLDFCICMCVRLCASVRLSPGCSHEP